MADPTPQTSTQPPASGDTQQIIERALALADRCRLEAFAECTLAEDVETALRDLAEIARGAPVHIGGDGPPEASCLICGERRVLAVWQWIATRAVGACEECRNARVQLTQDRQTIASLREDRNDILEQLTSVQHAISGRTHTRDTAVGDGATRFAGCAWIAGLPST